MNNDYNPTQEAVIRNVEVELHAKRPMQVTADNRMYWYNAPELAEYFGVTPATIYNWMRKDYFPYLQQGGRKYVHVTVLRWIDRMGRNLAQEQRRLFPKLVHNAVTEGRLQIPG